MDETPSGARINKPTRTARLDEYALITRVSKASMDEMVRVMDTASRIVGLAHGIAQSSARASDPDNDGAAETHLHNQAERLMEGYLASVDAVVARASAAMQRVAQQASSRSRGIRASLAGLWIFCDETLEGTLPSVIVAFLRRSAGAIRSCLVAAEDHIAISTEEKALGQIRMAGARARWNIDRLSQSFLERCRTLSGERREKDVE